MSDHVFINQLKAQSGEKKKKSSECFHLRYLDGSSQILEDVAHEMESYSFLK